MGTNTAPISILTRNQKRIFTAENVTVDGQKYRKVTAIVRFDDECGNGHNTFSITGSAWSPRNFKANDPDTGGCIHEIIEAVFPELAPLIKWHLASADQPMHYVANTKYLASERDCWGLLKGEKRQIVNGRTGLPCWELAAIVDGVERTAKVDGIPNRLDAAEQPPAPAAGLVYVPWCRVGEGKAADIESARRTAIWPDATLEQLQDEEALKARLPALLWELKAAVESLGMVF